MNCRHSILPSSFEIPVPETKHKNLFGYSTKNQVNDIIGFIDSGIWPESPSFSDYGMPPVLSTNLLHDEALNDSPDWKTFSLIYGSGGGAIEEAEESVTEASSSWSCSSQGRVCRDEIERNEETEDTASSIGAKMVTSVDDANSKEELLSTSMKEENAAEEKRISTDSPPTEDCCPICFRDISVPVRAPCGHWYCDNFFISYRGGIY